MDDKDFEEALDKLEKLRVSIEKKESELKTLKEKEQNYTRKVRRSLRGEARSIETGTRFVSAIRLLSSRRDSTILRLGQYTKFRVTNHV